MRLSSSCAAAAALIGSSLLVGGCAKQPLPGSPVAAPLSDVQAIALAEEYLDDQATTHADDRTTAAGARRVAYVEPTGDGNIVSFRSAFSAAGAPPVESRLIKVDHDGDVREIRFRRGG